MSSAVGSSEQQHWRKRSTRAAGLTLAKAKQRAHVGMARQRRTGRGDDNSKTWNLVLIMASSVASPHANNAGPDMVVPEPG